MALLLFAVWSERTSRWIDRSTYLADFNDWIGTVRVERNLQTQNQELSQRIFNYFLVNKHWGVVSTIGIGKRLSIKFSVSSAFKALILSLTICCRPLLLLTSPANHHTRSNSVCSCKNNLVLAQRGCNCSGGASRCWVRQEPLSHLRTADQRGFGLKSVAWLRGAFTRRQGGLSDL